MKIEDASGDGSYMEFEKMPDGKFRIEISLKYELSHSIYIENFEDLEKIREFLKCTNN